MTSSGFLHLHRRRSVSAFLAMPASPVEDPVSIR